MKRIINIHIVGILLVFLVSSCDYLDKEFDASVSEEDVFTNVSNSRAFLSNVYSFVPNDFSNDVFFSNIINAHFDCACDNGTQAGMHTKIELFTQGGINETNNPQEFRWGQLWTGIRKASKYIEYADDVPCSNYAIPGDDENFLRNRYKAEARLLRAFYYFELMKRWGALPIYDIDAALTMANDLNPTRSSMTEVADFIARECDKAHADLPFVYKNASNQGRVTGAMALALKSRALLYAASPWENTGGDAARWQLAADAAKALMSQNSGQFSLYPKYDETFTVMFNQEIIFSCHPVNNVNIETHDLPTGFANCVGYSNPSQDLVDAYEMSNGMAISDAGSGYDDQNPYVNRDPRFDYTIMHHGSTWFGREIDVKDDGVDRSGNITTKTGYFVRKWLNPNVTLNPNVGQWHMWIHFRYAEVLLNYAEAQNEVAGPDASVYDAINKIRARVGMPELPAGLSKEQMRERIHNERRIELAFESHRYYDVRRWGKAYDLLNKPLRGVRIKPDGNGGVTYTYEKVEDRKFENKHNFYPIPYEERIKSPNLGQNPGYGSGE